MDILAADRSRTRGYAVLNLYRMGFQPISTLNRLIHAATLMVLPIVSKLYTFLIPKIKKEGQYDGCSNFGRKKRIYRLWKGG